MIEKMISHYRILEELGRGGMGVVYRALDSNLHREVALKFLPEFLDKNREALARFQREARLLASVQHPNIAVVHGLETTEDRRFIVMELARGETLARRLSHGSLPLDEALAVCVQIAAGLETAHEHGIIHRDLKPSNLMLSEEGSVKILDFGLARFVASEGTAEEISEAETITQTMTLPGTIMGSMPYMSPEQATGRRVDKRTDIWAFGCVLYECLCGRPAFEGSDATEILAAILEREPDWSAIPSIVPSPIRTLLRRCLQKDAAQRLRDIGDARLEIQECANYPAEGVSPPRRFARLAVAASVLGALLLATTLWLLLTRNTPPKSAAPMVVSTLRLGDGLCLDGYRRKFEQLRPTRTAFAIAGDGSFLVYSAVLEDSPLSEAESQLYLRWLDQPEAHPILGTEGGIDPFLSPDDRWVGFEAEGKLKKIPIEGGVATTVCAEAPSYGASWGSLGTIVFSGERLGLSHLPAEGGPVEELTTPNPERGEYCHMLPHQLPGEVGLLFTVRKGRFDTKPQLFLWRKATGKHYLIMRDAADGRYLPTGHVVFLRRGTLMAVGFDLSTLEILGQPVALVDGIAQALSRRNSSNQTGAGQFGISRSGTLVYAAGGVVPLPRNELVWVDQRGEEQLVTEAKLPYLAPRLSPDGQRVVFSQDYRIGILDLRTDVITSLTREGEAVFPLWTHDGLHIVSDFIPDSQSECGPYWWPSDGSAGMEPLIKPGTVPALYSGCASSDGHSIAITTVHSDNNDIAILDLISHMMTPFLDGEYSESYPAFSPDGRMLAYASDESGRYEVYVVPYPGREWKVQVSKEGGCAPLWARDGKRLFYRSLVYLESPKPSRKVWVAEVRAGGQFSCGRPRPLFEKRGYGRSTPVGRWDISLDSKRFLMVKLHNPEPSPLTELTLVQNWSQQLE